MVVTHGETNSYNSDHFMLHTDEAIPNPVMGIGTTQTLKDGNWDDPTTWSNQSVPNSNDSLIILHRVTLNGKVEANNIIVDCGSIFFNPFNNTQLKISNIICIGCGAIIVGEENQPIMATAEIVIKDTPINITTDPTQFLTGIIATDISAITMFGKKKTTEALKLRLKREPLKGHTTLIMENIPEGWEVGDTVILPPTNPIQYTGWIQPGQEITEEFTITNINGSEITLDHPLQYNHEGAYTPKNVLTFLPHLVNISRNIKIRSENPNGTRGHILFTGHTNINVNYTEFRDLGRTTGAVVGSNNQKGRYSVHFHHVYGPANPTNTGYQFKFIGNAVTYGRKWGIVLHQTNYGLIQANNVFDFQTAGFATEEGNESYNLIDNNVVIKVVDTADRELSDCYWFANPSLNYVTNNIAASAYGSDYFGTGYHVDPMRSNRGTNEPRPFPLFRGADLMESTQVEMKRYQSTVFAQFENNEIYAVSRGISLDHYGLLTNPVMLLKNSKIWATWVSSFYSYGGGQQVEIDGLIVRKVGWGCMFQDAQQGKHIYHNLDLQSRESWLGVAPYALQWAGGVGGQMQVTLDNVHIDCHQGIIMILSPSGSSLGDERKTMSRTLVASNITIENTMTGVPNYFKLMPRYDPNFASRSPMAKHQVLVHNFQNKLCNCMQIFWKEQAPNAPAPYEGDIVDDYKFACPESGLTNQQCWDKYQLAFAGELATTTKEVPGIVGYVSGTSI